LDKELKNVFDTKKYSQLTNQSKTIKKILTSAESITVEVPEVKLDNQNIRRHSQFQGSNISQPDDGRCT